MPRPSATSRERVLALAVAACLTGGCARDAGVNAPSAASLPSRVAAENQAFLGQKAFDPWLLTCADPGRAVNVYMPTLGQMIGAGGKPVLELFPNQYDASSVIDSKQMPDAALPAHIPPGGYTQTLDLRAGSLVTRYGPATYAYSNGIENSDWPQFWQRSDIAVAGDPEAQQSIHAEMYYLAGSAAPNHSIPPMGQSSLTYQGHIFWDAEIWMFPALIVQHPELAYGIIDYRAKRLAQARANARAAGLPGASYPWESAATGAEEAPAEFAAERHITADVALAAWQYYLWTGDKEYLAQTGWPVISACAAYWSARVAPGKRGGYDIRQVLGPDETSGLVDNDAWTNGVVATSLRAAAVAARVVGRAPDPRWLRIAAGLNFPRDAASGAYLEHAGDVSRLEAKQADAQMLIYPLQRAMTPAAAGATLDTAMAHTSRFGPAMTDSINALIAARLGRGPQSLELFRSSYRPFLRAPFDAFSEKRTRDNVYFCTGMGGCLQTVLYGFAGLNVAGPGDTGRGRLIARSGDTALYADPHLPPGWSSVTVKGIVFRGRVYTLVVGQGDSVLVTPGGPGR